MGRPKRDRNEEHSAAVEEFETMRRVDEELLGLAEEIDEALQAGFRPKEELLPEDPPRAGKVTSYFVDKEALAEAWGDSEKLTELILAARKDG